MSLSLNVLTTAIVIIVNVCVTLTIVLYTSTNDCTPHYRIVSATRSHHICAGNSLFTTTKSSTFGTHVYKRGKDREKRTGHGAGRGREINDERRRERENLHPRETRIAFSFFLPSFFSSFSFRLERCSFFSSLFIHLGQVLAELPQNRQRKKEESGKRGRETENSNERADT